MKTQIIKSIITLAFFSLLIFVLGLLIAYPISYYFHTDFNNIVSIEGIMLTLLTLFFSVNANPSGFGSRNLPYIENSQFESSLKEKSTVPFLKNYTKLSVISLTFSRLTLVFGGIFLIIYGIIKA